MEIESPPSTPRTGEEPVVEPRWPIALAVLVFIAISAALRIAEPVHEVGELGTWVLYGIEVVLLVALIAADSAHVSRGTRWFRWVAIALTMTLAAVTLTDTASLIVQLVRGGEVTESAGALLAAGAAVWLANCLVFGILYWQLDNGGPLARSRRERPVPSFAFPQQINPELAPPGWLPRYHDYLALGFTTNTAFSPTDAMPMSAWAKLTMALQSLISVIILGLVIARAVNVLS